MHFRYALPWLSIQTVLAVSLPFADIDPSTQLNKRSLAYSEPHYPSPWMDPKAIGWEEAYEKAKAFVSQLTLLEKVNLTTGIGWGAEQCVGQTGAIPRLGLKSMCMQDAPLAIRGTDYNSVFPAGVTTAATFDRGLMYKRGYALGQEAKGKGVTVLLGPVAGPLGRAPEGGRNWEGFSTDPVLTGIAMAETIKGTQDAGVVACAKHFIGNEQEHFRQVGESQDYGYNISETLSSNIDDKTMHEMYLWPFVDAIRAGVGSFMCAYTQANNSYSCQNSKLLNNLLKQENGFQGFVMSDWQAHHSGVASAAAGLDMSMPGDTLFNSGRSYWGTNLTLAVLNGTVPQWRIDDMAMRIMAAFFKVGQTVEDQETINFSFWTLDTYGPLHWAARKDYQQINWHVNVQGDHGSLIREIAARGTVLLKNTGSLPLKKPKFLAVIGEDAGPNPLGPNGCADNRCNNGTLGIGWGSGTGNFPYLVTPDQALQARAVQDGSRYESVLRNHAPTEIKALVSQQDATAIVFVNANSGEGFIEIDGNKGDRLNLTLWNEGDALVKNVSSWCNNTIVVLHTPGPVLLTEWHDNPNITAILWAGMPGQESGNSITDVLYGRVNPSGRTPFTWGATRESYGTDVLYEPNNGNEAPQLDYTEGVFIDYRHFDKANASVLYEFGFGLSYTTFEYSNLKIEKHQVGEYTPTTGQTEAAPTFGNFSESVEDYVFPAAEFPYVYQFIYPYLNSTDMSASSGDAQYGQTAEEFLPPKANDGSAQPLLRSSGLHHPGGNPALYDIMYTVTADITNTGKVAGDEVPQLYVSLGGPEDPKVVLRGFDRLRVEPEEKVQFKAVLTRRDVSSWDTVKQDWVITEYAKKVYVGPSSRKLDLEEVLP
ncbi:beta-glucosidase 1 precursor [Neurospora tetrasperma FGSC 2508]|uniref:beta-glucosidase n=1 Tax=Neurospora tetrasperma (strain FGSC 2508 / ATCC MYA-4615 / P0657) TaxID=510951 RepID=F8MLZ5_NEUT8|nr:beta-glucosidase 1 precursor [Neurospora tetrasperma FGSC 2508]EGO58510.1 beta-glucosidase 1 precursor [Neurospora tetrasperma FGSC 2508]EGZ71150.1 beta-glucosidase 1 precursor [Neurospora tetrasperma FGSC 2509]